MKICNTISAMRASSRVVRGEGKRLGFVPTMGALHAGHLSLVRLARQRCEAVAVSIFVNPTQFAPNEDFTRYPRTFERDCELLKEEGVDLVFAPSAQEMYPEPQITWVTVEGLSERLCGRSRPGHFRAVATVVAKLFHIVEPDAAFFGQKDAVQLAVLRRMVRDLNLPVEIAAGPIVREADGLAMSSRNAYLDTEQRATARVLSRSLMAVKELFEAGQHSVDKLVESGKREFSTEPAARLEYFEIVDPDTLEPLSEASKKALAAVAAWIGTTRLIDNLLLGN